MGINSDIKSLQLAVEEILQTVGFGEPEDFLPFFKSAESTVIADIDVFTAETQLVLAMHHVHILMQLQQILWAAKNCVAITGEGNGQSKRRACREERRRGPGGGTERIFGV